MNIFLYCLGHFRFSSWFVSSHPENCLIRLAPWTMADAASNEDSSESRIPGSSSSASMCSYLPPGTNIALREAWQHISATMSR